MTNSDIPRIRKLALAYLRAKQAFSKHYWTKPSPFDDENEDHIRWEMAKNRLCRETVRMEQPYREACDAFFAREEESATA